MRDKWADDDIKETIYMMALGALDSIQKLLDEGGIPRGTFAYDQVRNLVAMYNKCKKLLATERVIAIRGSDDVPAFQVCVESEMDNIHKELLNE